MWLGEGDDGVPSSAKGRRYGLRLPLGIVIRYLEPTQRGGGSAGWDSPLRLNLLYTIVASGLPITVKNIVMQNCDDELLSIN